MSLMPPESVLPARIVLSSVSVESCAWMPPTKLAELPTIVEHRAKGRRAVFVRNGRVVLASGEYETPIVSLKSIPLTDGGQIDCQVDNVLAATAAAWALGVGPELIRTGLETFTVV